MSDVPRYILPDNHIGSNGGWAVEGDDPTATWDDVIANGIESGTPRDDHIVVCSETGFRTTWDLTDPGYLLPFLSSRPVYIRVRHAQRPSDDDWMEWEVELRTAGSLVQSWAMPFVGITEFQTDLLQLDESVVLLLNQGHWDNLKLRFKTIAFSQTGPDLGSVELQVSEAELDVGDLGVEAATLLPHGGGIQATFSESIQISGANLEYIGDGFEDIGGLEMLLFLDIGKTHTLLDAVGPTLVEGGIDPGLGAAEVLAPLAGLAEPVDASAAAELVSQAAALGTILAQTAAASEVFVDESRPAGAVNPPAAAVELVPRDFALVSLVTIPAAVIELVNPEARPTLPIEVGGPAAGDVFVPDLAAPTNPFSLAAAIIEPFTPTPLVTCPIGERLGLGVRILRLGPGMIGSRTQSLELRLQRSLSL